MRHGWALIAAWVVAFSGCDQGTGGGAAPSSASSKPASSRSRHEVQVDEAFEKRDFLQVRRLLRYLPHDRKADIEQRLEREALAFIEQTVALGKAALQVGDAAKAQALLDDAMKRVPNNLRPAEVLADLKAGIEATLARERALWERRLGPQRTQTAIAARGHSDFARLVELGRAVIRGEEGAVEAMLADKAPWGNVLSALLVARQPGATGASPLIEERAPGGAGEEPLRIWLRAPKGDEPAPTVLLLSTAAEAAAQVERLTARWQGRVAVAAVALDGDGDWGDAGIQRAVRRALATVGQSVLIDRRRVWLGGAPAGWSLLERDPALWAGLLVSELPEAPLELRDPGRLAVVAILPEAEHGRVAQLLPRLQPLVSPPAPSAADGELELLTRHQTRAQLSPIHMFDRREVQRRDDLLITEFDPSRELDTARGARRLREPARLGLQRAGNTLRIVESDGIIGLELLITPARFDIRQPVAIEHRGKVIGRWLPDNKAESLIRLAGRFPLDEVVGRLAIELPVTSWTERYAGTFEREDLERLGREDFEALVALLRGAFHDREPDLAAIAAKLEAELAAERLAPELLDGLIRLARVGRGLGPGNHVREIELPTHKFKYFVKVPSLPPGKRVPLIVDLHGGGGGGGHLRLMADTMGEMRDDAGGEVIVALPSAGRGVGWGPGQAGLGQVTRMVDELQRLTPVDPDRIILRGFSMGGAGCWSAAVIEPWRWAAVNPVAARVHPHFHKLFPNLWLIGIWVVHRTGDPIVPPDSARAAAAELMKVGHPSIVFKEYKGKEHIGEPPHEGPAMMRWLFTRRRKPRPGKLMARCVAPRPQRFAYMRTLRYAPGRATAALRSRRGQPEQWFREPPAITLSRRGNTFTISERDGVSEIELLMDIHLIDWARPIVVREGERELLRKRLTPTLEERLRYNRQFPDLDVRAVVRIKLD